MTEFVLALIPQYGLYVVFGVVLIASTGVPLPASVVVLTAGALAAAGDMSVWQVIPVVVIAYWIGDQLAFNVARVLGPNLLTRLQGSRRMAKVLIRSETLLERYGLLAVFLSRTVFSQAGPYVGYITGATQMNWFKFSAAAMPAAVLWSATYAMIGFLFAGNVPQVSNLVLSIVIVSVAALVAIAFAIRIVILWRRFDMSAAVGEAVTDTAD